MDRISTYALLARLIPSAKNEVVMYIRKDRKKKMTEKRS